MNIAESKLIVCSIVRNAEKGLRRNMPVIYELCRMFRDYEIIIYENDSIDKTKNILKEWEKTEPERIHVISEDTNSSPTIPESKDTLCVNPFFSNRRISKMASLRNKYLDYVEKKNIAADYLMVVDLDVAQLYISGIIDSFEKADDWDVVTAYGYSMSPRLKKRYHDTYALTFAGMSIIPQTETDIHVNAMKMARICNNSKGLVLVESAFGGLAIYKFDAIRGLKYNVDKNDDDRVEVHCEHFSLNRQIALRGYNRIFVNPKMKLKYQGVTLDFILKKIKEKIKREFLIDRMVKDKNKLHS
jgi:glycosyltransferase involved in cell wall biosynthesis